MVPRVLLGCCAGNRGAGAACASTWQHPRTPAGSTLPGGVGWAAVQQCVLENDLQSCSGGNGGHVAKGGQSRGLMLGRGQGVEGWQPGSAE